MPKCPKCGSNRFHYELRSGGTSSTTRYYRTGVKKSWIVPSGRRSYSSNRKQKSVGICPDCGYTEEKGSGCSTIIGIVIIVIIISSLINGRDTDNKNTNTSSSQTSEETVWAQEYTPISDFDYYIDHDQIYIRDYRGDNHKVYVASSYDIDGADMAVIELEGVFTLDNISSAIISPGVMKMKDNIFNSCGVEYVYLPASLKEFDGWDYFHDGKKLYYEGTEEQFKALCDEERKDIDFTQILYETSIEDLFTETKTAI